MKTKIIGNQKRKSRIDFDLADRLNEYYSNPENLKKETQEQNPINQNPEPKIHPEEDFWLIKNVKYKNQTKNYKLKKQLLENKTQQEHIEYAKENPNDFNIQDLPVYHAIFKTIYNLPEQQEKQEIKDFLKKSIKDYWLLTGTQIDYTPKRKDIINHRIENQSIKENIVGPDEWVKNSKTPEVYKALLQDSNLENINNIYKWITEKDQYLWRINSKPKNIEKRLVGLGSADDRSVFNADDGLSYSSRCFGVLEDWNENTEWNTWRNSKEWNL